EFHDAAGGRGPRWTREARRRGFKSYRARQPATQIPLKSVTTPRPSRHGVERRSGVARECSPPGFGLPPAVLGGHALWRIVVTRPPRIPPPAVTRGRRPAVFFTDVPPTCNDCRVQVARAPWGPSCPSPQSHIQPLTSPRWVILFFPANSACPPQSS